MRDGSKPPTGTGEVSRSHAATNASRPVYPSPRHRQRGVGMTGMMIIAGVAIFLGLFAFKVGPHYFENMTVSAIAEDVSKNEELLRGPRSKVYQHLNQQYRTNNLWDLRAEDTIQLKKDGKRGYVLTVRYEKRANLFHNIDLVTSFDKEVGEAS